MSDDKSLEQREEERLLRSLQKKSGPQTIDELRKKKEQDQKRKLEQDKKKQEQEEAKKKEAQLQQQKLENLKQQRAAEEKAAKEREAEREREQRAQNERNQQQQAANQPVKATQAADDDDDEDAAKEAARMSKMFGLAPAKAAEPHRTGVDALLHKDLGRQEPAAPAKAAAEPKPVEKDWRDQQEDFIPRQTVHDETDEDAEAKEAARMAKMFGLTPQRLTTESPKHQKLKGFDTTHVPYVNEDDATAAKEADRMARMMGGTAKNYDGREEAKEKERKMFEQSIQGISDPRELSRAFLKDSEMMGHLKDVKGAIAVNTLKGVDIPGGHKF